MTLIGRRNPDQADLHDGLESLLLPDNFLLVRLGLDSYLSYLYPVLRLSIDSGPSCLTFALRHTFALERVRSTAARQSLAFQRLPLNPSPLSPFFRYVLRSTTAGSGWAE